MFVNGISMKNSLLPFKIFQNLGLILLLVCQLKLNTFYAQEISPELIEQELTRAQLDPDQSIEILVNAPLSYVFNFLSLRLNEYVEGARAIEFNHSNSEAPGKLGVGSIRKLTMENDAYLIQKFLQFQLHIGYAYFTDMDKSTLQAPLNYSLSRYEFSETKEGQTIVRISVVYQSSSRLLAYFVRRAFSSSLRRDFERAAATIEFNYQNNS